MNWIDIVWPMMGAASLTLALIHVLIWVTQRSRTDHLMFALICVSVAAIAIFELLMMRAQTPERYAEVVRWTHVPVVLTFVGMVCFVRLHFRAGNIWLGAAVIAARCATIFPDFLSGANLNFREITALRQLPVWGGSGDTIAAPIGVPNPWMALGTFSIVLLVVFLIDATMSVWRRNDSEERSSALVVCGSMVLFAVLAGGWTFAVVHGVIHAPLIVIPAFLGVVLVMSHDLGGVILRAAHLAKSLNLSESNLRESEQRMALAVRATNIGLWNWDIASGETWHSETGLRMLGFAPDGKFDRARFHERVHPADRDVLQEALERAMQGSGEFQSEYRIVSADGRVHWIAARGQVEFDATHTPWRLNGVLLDITERRQADERFQLVVEAAPTAMLMVNSDDRIVLANHQAEIVFGYSRVELVGMNVDALLPTSHRDGHPSHRATYSGDATTRTMGAGRELLARRKDGSEVAVEIGLTPIPIDANRFVLASITDISERKRLERESAVQRDELAHLSRIALLSELSGSLAHELNQPLTAILSNAQAAVRFLAHTPPDLEEVLESLTNIVESDKRAGEVIRRLRAMLRKDPADHRSLDMNEVVQDVLRIIRSDLLNRNVEVIVDLSPKLPLVKGDRVQLQQVLLNLIVNGSDAMADVAVGRALTVRTRASEPGVEVAVSDVGRGIPPDELERIFSPFVTSKADGLGLGLAVCTTIIHAHQGSLWATNNAERGATLHFSLPTSDGFSTDRTRLG